MKHLTSGTVALVISFVVAATSNTYAAVCPVNNVTQADQMTAVSGCSFGSVNDDTDSPSQVNVDQLFGFDDWVLVDRTQYPLGYRQGDWTLPDAGSFWDTHDRALLVLKGGYDGSTPDYIGYLLVEADGTEGHWITPTYLTAINHISLYVHATDGEVTPVTAVPLPSALPLFLTALVGIGVIARRKKHSS